jgi:hypothetical protein
LATAIASACADQDASLDSEIVCLNQAGEPQFNVLLFRRAQPWFYAFDLLCLNGGDARDLPLLERKRPTTYARTPRSVPASLSRARPLAWARPLQRHLRSRPGGQVGKLAASRYVKQPPPWVKVLNPAYSQKHECHDLFAGTPYETR